MATTTFNGPVRSEKGFQQVNKNTSTGAYTVRTLGMKPDLTSLTASTVATGATLTYAANTITVNDFDGNVAQAVTLPAATAGTVVVHYQSDDTNSAGGKTLTFTCAGSDVYRTGSKVESRTTGAYTPTYLDVKFDFTGMTYAAVATGTSVSLTADYVNAVNATGGSAAQFDFPAATNSLTHGCFIYFTCFEKGTWDFAYDFANGATFDTGAAAWS